MYSIRSRPARVKTLPLEAKRPWGGLGTSVGFHTLLVAMLLGLMHRTPPEPNDPASNPPVAVPVQMVYLQPTAPAAPEPTRSAESPAPDAVHAESPEAAQSTDANQDRPPELSREEPRSELPEPRERVTPTVAQRQPEPQPQPEHTETIEEQAQRLFGRPLLQREDTPTQLGIRPGNLSNQDQAERTTCLPKPRDPKAPREMAELIGRVYNENSRPLAGAFLQIIGTSYSTYSDRSGLYRLVFDASLVDECRTQYVRVVANGYRGRNLVLGIGPGVNDVVLNH